MKKYLYVYVKIYESCDTWNKAGVELPEDLKDFICN